MTPSKRILALSLVLGALLLAVPGPSRVLAAEGSSSPALARVIYLTRSEGCACTMKRCGAGDELVAQLFGGERAALLSRVDLATAGAAAQRAYMKDYHVVLPPALIFLDPSGKVLWSAQGDLHGDEVLHELEALGR